MKPEKIRIGLRIEKEMNDKLEKISQAMSLPKTKLIEMFVAQSLYAIEKTNNLIATPEFMEELKNMLKTKKEGE